MPTQPPFSPGRRHFMKTSAALAAGSLLMPGLARSTAAGHPAPARHVKDIGIQLYTVRAEMLADPAGTLRKLAKIGYRELESARSDKGNYYGLKPKEIRRIAEDL